MSESEYRDGIARRLHRWFDVEVEARGVYTYRSPITGDWNDKAVRADILAVPNKQLKLILGDRGLLALPFVIECNFCEPIKGMADAIRQCSNYVCSEFDGRMPGWGFVSHPDFARWAKFIGRRFCDSRSNSAERFLRDQTFGRMSVARRYRVGGFTITLQMWAFWAESDGDRKNAYMLWCDDKLHVVHQNPFWQYPLNERLCHAV